MSELWQLYDENRKALTGHGATPADVWGQGLLHGAAHVWVWRVKNGAIEVLVQKRAAIKPTWPNMWDIPAGGHIDLGETPEQAAQREAKEEIDLDVNPAHLHYVECFRNYRKAGTDLIENEFQWVFLYQADTDVTFQKQESEVAEIMWLPFDEFSRQVLTEPAAGKYVPKVESYFETLLAALQAAEVSS